MPYFVHAGRSITDGVLGEHCHEFTHLLGIADSYGVGHVTGFGDFCLMAIGHRGGGGTGARSPFSLCAHCRLRLGWCDVVRIDPDVPQRLRLAAPSEERDVVVQVPLSKGGEEFVLLETRAHQGFDAELPSAGLLVWHVGGRPTPGQGPYGGPVDLIEAHGVDTFDASLVRVDEIAFPTERARDITPRTQPTVRSAAAGAADFHLTDIERLADAASRSPSASSATSTNPRRRPTKATWPVPTATCYARTPSGTRFASCPSGARARAQLRPTPRAARAGADRRSAQRRVARRQPPLVPRVANRRRKRPPVTNSDQVDPRHRRSVGPAVRIAVDAVSQHAIRWRVQVRTEAGRPGVGRPGQQQVRDLREVGRCRSGRPRASGRRLRSAR